MNLDPKSELASLAKYKTTEMEGDMLVIAHYTATRDWDRVANRLITLQRNASLLAGYVSQLLPCVPAGDVPEMKMP